MTVVFTWIGPLSIQSAVSNRGSCGVNGGSLTVTCGTGFWSPGNDVLITIVGRPTAPGTINLRTTARPTQLELNTGNNDYNGSQSIAPSADLRIQFVSTSQPPAPVGSGVVVNANVYNAGPSAAQSPTIRFTLPFGIRFSSGAGCVPVGATRDVDCTIGPLNSGVIANVPLQAVAGRRGTYTLAASVRSSTHEPNGANNAGSVVCAPAPLPGCPASGGVRTQPAVSASGNGVAVAISAGTSTVGGNRLEGVQFVGGPPYVGGERAMIDIGSVVGQGVGYDHLVETEPASLSFTLRRSSPGPMTVGLLVSDHCGTWSTFVGSGS